jgi:TfoX/Sxy family transcriptional regulator of competence genes
MAYDEDLADRIRDLLAEEPDLSERKMFGGLAFLLGGHMVVAASGRGGAMVRVDPADADGHLARSKAEPMVMRGRPMAGWLRVASDDLRTTRQLARWVDRATAYVRTLPPKG